MPMTDENSFWYVLFVRTGTEERIVKILEDKLNTYGLKLFVLQKTCVFRREGKKTEFRKTCFPGYIFIESTLPVRDLFVIAFPILFRLNDVYRFLNNGDPQDIAMPDEERKAMSALFNDNHCIDMSSGYKEGDCIQIVSGALTGTNSKIEKIDKHKNEAIVVLSMFGTLVRVSVGFEVVKKVSE